MNRSEALVDADEFDRRFGHAPGRPSFYLLVKDLTRPAITANLPEGRVPAALQAAEASALHGHSRQIAARLSISMRVKSNRRDAGARPESNP
jgi:hypothetical protein